MSQYQLVGAAKADAYDNGFENAGQSGSQSSSVGKLGMLAFAGIRASEPLLFFVTFPFINEMLLEYGIGTDARSTGYYAGILEASIQLGSAVSIPVWAHLADTSGRRPVLLTATALTALLGLTNGFPRSFGMLLFLRILVGLMNGQSAMSKNYMSELCDESSEASSFAFVGLSWQVGWCAAAAAGGYLAHAERTFPSLGGLPLVSNHPYALPFLVMAVPPLLAVWIGYYSLPETLPAHRMGRKKFGRPKFEEWTPDMWNILKIWGMMILTNTAFQALLPLFFFAPISAGGLGASTSSIGLWYAVRAVAIIAVEFPIYPTVHRVFGRKTVLRAQVFLYPACYLLFPIISTCQRWYGSTSSHMAPSAMLFIAGLFTIEILAQTMFISGDLLCTNAGPTPELRSEYNAWVEWTAKVLTTVSVWLWSSIFAFSAETQLLNGYLVWYLLVAWSIYFCWTVYNFRDPVSWRVNNTSDM